MNKMATRQELLIIRLLRCSWNEGGKIQLRQWRVYLLRQKCETVLKNYVKVSNVWTEDLWDYVNECWMCLITSVKTSHEPSNGEVLSHENQSATVWPSSKACLNHQKFLYDLLINWPSRSLNLYCPCGQHFHWWLAIWTSTSHHNSSDKIIFISQCFHIFINPVYNGNWTMNKWIIREKHDELGRETPQEITWR